MWVPRTKHRVSIMGNILLDLLTGKKSASHRLMQNNVLKPEVKATIAANQLEKDTFAADAPAGDTLSKLVDLLSLIPGPGAAVKSGAPIAAAMFVPASRILSKIELADVQKMISKGIDRREIMAKYGAYEGPIDKKLRTILDPTEAKLVEANIPRYSGNNDLTDFTSKPWLRLPDILNFPALFKAIPESQDTKIKQLMQSGGGSYTSSTNTMGIGIFDMSDPKSIDSLLSTLLHEGQHVVQNVGKHSRGGSPELFLPAGFDKLHSKVTSTYDNFLQYLDTKGYRTNKDIADLEQIVKAKQSVDDMYNKAIDKYTNLAGEREAFTAEKLKRISEVVPPETMKEILNTIPTARGGVYGVPVRQLTQSPLDALLNKP